MSLADFIEDVKSREKTLTVFTPEDDDQLFDELVGFFEVQNITVREGHVEPGGPQNFVVLHQEDEAVAVSTLEDVRETLFIDGGRSGFGGVRVDADESETPDVVTSLGNTTFSADGEDRFLLTQIAHYIQELAWRSGGGRLHSGVQRLSTLREDASAHEICRKLADRGVGVHVYGAPDADVATPPGIRVYPEDDPEVADVRFVAFDGDGDDSRKGAMVATEEEPGSFRGFWTFEASFVDEIIAYLERTYGA